MGPFGCAARLPYERAWQGSPLPDTTAISSNSWPGDELFPDTSRVDDVPPTVLCDSLRPRRDSTSRLAVDITMLTKNAQTIYVNQIRKITSVLIAVDSKKINLFKKTIKLNLI